jgi:hypothetical protein
MKRIIEGYLEVNYEDTSVYPTEEEIKHLPRVTLNEQIGEFNGKKVRITIEEI